MVFDTCALLAFARREPMRLEAIRRIDEARKSRVAYVSAVVALEIAQKCATGRLRPTSGATARAWYEQMVRVGSLREVPVSAHMALAAYELPEPFHRDPADRLIVAMARLLDAPVVTVDRQILAYGRLGHVRTMAY